MYTSPTEQSLRLLEISQLPGIGQVALKNIAEYAITQGFSEIKNDDLIINMFAKKGHHSKNKKVKTYNSIISDCEANEINIISYLDEEYPAKLKQIPDPPIFLYAKGNISTLNLKCWAVVGTRKASKLGLDWSRQISQLLVSKDIGVVSGLAFGIDTAAHEGALSKDGKTIAVLANGLDEIQPRKNKDLAEKIIENDGLLMSTQPPKSQVRNIDFARRNRIQSGLSECSIIVESGFEGGTIHHGNFALEQGHPLYCVLPDESTKGFNEFNTGGAIRFLDERKAKIIANREDLEKVLDSSKLK